MPRYTSLARNDNEGSRKTRAHCDKALKILCENEIRAAASLTSNMSLRGATRRSNLVDRRAQLRFTRDDSLDMGG